MIIDCHTHIFETGVGGPLNLPAAAEDLLREMDSHGVDMAIVLPLPGVASNEFVHRQCARFPERLAALYTPEFETPTETLDKMVEFFSHYSPKGLKIHPRWQGVTVEDTIVKEVLHWADENGHPVLFDVFPYGKTLEDPRLQPLAYNRLAQTMPTLKMVLAHAGGYRLMEAFLTAKSNPNVFLDISFTPVYFKGSSLADDCGFVCGRLPAGRVLYGSDYPYVRFGDSIQAAHQLLKPLDESIQASVFHEAASQLFRVRN